MLIPVFIILTLLIFALTALIEYKLIPILKSYKVGQKILEIGPRWHKHKEGTPTMGGIGFILAALIVLAGYFIYVGFTRNAATYIPLALTIGFALANGAIGFVDDYCKLIKKQNEGLTEAQKILLQFAVAAAYVTVMAYTGHLSTAVALPFTDATLELKWFWYPLAVLLLVGVINGANFTDGVDGLASSVTLVIGIFYAILGFAKGNEQLLVIGAALIAMMLGFLLFNFHPAKVFMGDTGSLFIGAMVIGGAFQIGEVAVGLIVSGVFIIEMLSSLLQKLVFKATKRGGKPGKRLFKMAPLHHHFEQCGWNEYRIMIVFSAVEGLFCILAGLAI